MKIIAATLAFLTVPACANAEQFNLFCTGKITFQEGSKIETESTSEIFRIDTATMV
jgi:hypothetical protein